MTKKTPFAGAPVSSIGGPTPNIAHLNLAAASGTPTLKVVLVDDKGKDIWRTPPNTPIGLTPTTLALGKLLLDANCPQAKWDAAVGAILITSADVRYNWSGSDPTGAAGFGWACDADDDVFAAGKRVGVGWVAR